MRRAACGISRDQEGSTRHGNANWNWHRNWYRAVSDSFDFRQSQFVAIPNFDKHQLVLALGPFLWNKGLVEGLGMNNAGFPLPARFWM